MQKKFVEIYDKMGTSVLLDIDVPYIIETNMNRFNHWGENTIISSGLYIKYFLKIEKYSYNFHTHLSKEQIDALIHDAKFQDKFLEIVKEDASL